MQDVERGHCAGPFRTRREVSDFVGTEAWIPTERFGVVQKEKTRGVDNAAVNSGSELNGATAVSEKLFLPSTDANVGMVKMLARRLGSAELAGWVLDEARAYRQIPIAPRHRKYAVIAVVEPATNDPAFFVMIGHSFGLVAAVYNFNRRAALITDFLQKCFMVAARNYYDDKFGFTSMAAAPQEVMIVRDLHRWLGVDYAEDKVQCSANPVVLGIGYDLRAKKLYVTPEREEDILRTIDDILADAVLNPACAAKLKGRLEHVATHFWGRFGRTFLRALSERQYGGGHVVTPAISRSLRFWRWLLRRGGRPRDWVSGEGALSDYVAFTDGFFPDPRETEGDRQPRVACAGEGFRR